MFLMLPRRGCAPTKKFLAGAKDEHGTYGFRCLKGRHSVALGYFVSGFQPGGWPPQPYFEYEGECGALALLDPMGRLKSVQHTLARR
jgi:hypothetical protein